MDKISYTVIISDKSVKAKPDTAMVVLEWTMREICEKLAKEMEKRGTTVIDLYGAKIRMDECPLGLEVSMTIPVGEV